ncbi:hypothetical protein BMETH_6851701665, partial [methanotrophic bacterial endosymbiont of Bathymodiolus sp.]
AHTDFSAGDQEISLTNIEETVY